MISINKQTLETIKMGFSALAEQGIEQAQPQYEKIATVVNSNSSENIYKWLGKMPSMNAWSNSRSIQNITNGEYTIVNKNYEVTLGVNANDIEDEDLGIYSPLFIELGRAAATYPDKLLGTLIKSGETSKCSDGVNFFSVVHPVKSSTDGTGTTNYKSNLTSSSSYTDGAWYVLATGRAIKPFIFQNRRKPTLKAVTDENDEKLFDENIYRYGIDMRCNVGFGIWQMAIKVKKTLNKTNLEAAMNSITSAVGDGLTTLGLKPNVLLVPPSLEIAAAEIVERKTITVSSSAVSNILKDRMQVIVLEHL